MDLEKSTIGGLVGSFDLLTEHGWVDASDVLAGEKVAVWDPETSAITQGVLNKKLVEEVRQVAVVNLNGIYTQQRLAANQNVWGEVLERSEGGHEPRWVRVKRRATDMEKSDVVLVSGFHSGEGCGLSREQVAVVGLVWAGMATMTDDTVVVSHQVESTDRSTRITGMLQRLAVQFPEDIRMVETDGHLECVISGKCALDVMDFYNAVSVGDSGGYEALWSMSLVEKNVFVWFSIHGQDDEMLRRSWCTVAPTAAGADWLRSLVTLTGFKSSAYVSHDATVVSVQQEARVNTNRADSSETEDIVIHVSVDAGGFLVRQDNTIFVAANS